jgi:hypothetical protein
MSTIRNFVDSEIQKTKALAIAMRTDPITTGLGMAIQFVAFGVGLWFIIQAAKWSFVTITSAF